MKHALSELPEDHLLFLAKVSREADRPGYAWIVAAIEWELRRRSSDTASEFPPHGIAATGLGDVAGHLWAFAARIRAHPDGVNLGGIIALLDAGGCGIVLGDGARNRSIAVTRRTGATPHPAQVWNLTVQRGRPLTRARTERSRRRPLARIQLGRTPAGSWPPAAVRTAVATRPEPSR